ncbi:MAG: hypothetical protein JNL08_04980 [Planctomycetes bacterium]|nr:hypothetical protein [Planctomycetota bacterium]
MPKPKPKRRRRILRTVGIVAGALVVFLLLFVVAFVFNPLEGSLPELRDVVPRGVNFFVRKQRLADDFATFPEPRFWAELADARAYPDLMQTRAVQELKRGGLERALQEAGDTFQRVRQDSGGWLDVMRDLIGTELIVAGYEIDYTQQPPKPLAQPWWCVYTRVSWRVRAADGLARFGFVQEQLRQNGVDVTEQDGMLVAKVPGVPTPIYVKRHLDALMVANHTLLLEQSQRLIDGNRDEEPIGQMPAYTDGAVQRIEQWAEKRGVEVPNVLEFVVEPNAFDGFARFATGWPNPQNKDSMNERVLASFVNLKGWQQVTGGLLFGPEGLTVTGQVGLNSKQHTGFQSSFYRAEQQRREEWLDPFLAMVPESACAAAALRMPAGEFLYAMFDALDQAERDLINDGMKRAVFQGTQLTDTRELIEKLKVAFLPRTGFVFRRNVPDTDRDEQGNLKVPVTARSPMPQVAWVFWLRPNTNQLVDDFVGMLRSHFQTFGFRRVYYLRVPHASGMFAEPVSEFTHPAIPATGSIAMIVFRDFFVVSNSGPLVRDILRTRYPALSGARSMRELPEFRAWQDTMPAELNGVVWLRGETLVPVLDDYLQFADAASEMPDPDWLRQVRPTAEDQVRRARYPQFPSVASIPKPMTEPGGEFDQAVVAHMQELWRRERTNFTADDRQQMQQLRSFAGALRAAAVEVELENSYIRFRASVLPELR